MQRSDDVTILQSSRSCERPSDIPHPYLRANGRRTMRLQSEDRSQHSKSREIEAALQAHSGVQRAAVIMWEDERSSEGKITGYVVPNDDHVARVLGGARTKVSAFTNGAKRTI